jgi:glycosyltransferase involved in cell wall biosynthesis
MAVYNAEDFLSGSLESLLRQTLGEELQIICVDDASTDTSLSILHEYARKDSRIEVIPLEKNSGQAHARNVGLRQSMGDYICMLDADDSFSDDALQKAVDVMESDDDMDCVLFEVSKDWPDHSEIYAMPPFRVLSGDEAFRMSLTWQIHGLYMVKANIHQRYPYDETCRLYSDDNTTRMHYLASRKVGRCSGVYHYRQHAASSTHKISVRRFDYLRANESMKKKLLEIDADSEVLALYENHRWINLIDVYMFYFEHGHDLLSSERRYGLSEMHRIWSGIDRSLLSHEVSRKIGHFPMPTWRLFLVQEWIYFTLRHLFGRNS